MIMYIDTGFENSVYILLITWHNGMLFLVLENTGSNPSLCTSEVMNLKFFWNRYCGVRHVGSQCGVRWCDVREKIKYHAPRGTLM